MVVDMAVDMAAAVFMAGAVADSAAVVEAFMVEAFAAAGMHFTAVDSAVVDSVRLHQLSAAEVFTIVPLLSVAASATVDLASRDAASTRPLITAIAAMSNATAISGHAITAMRRVTPTAHAASAA